MRLPGWLRLGRGGNDDGPREVFRSPGAVVLWWVWLAAAVLVLVDLIVQGRGRSAVVAALVVLAITGIAWAAAGRPRVVAGSAGVIVVNPLRDHFVPWAAFDKVDVTSVLRIHCVAAPGAAKGKVITSWAVQSTARSVAKRELRARRAEMRLPRFAAGTHGYGAPSGGRAKMHPAVREAAERTLAQHAAVRISERARLARQAKQAAGPRRAEAQAARAEAQAARAEAPQAAQAQAAQAQAARAEVPQAAQAQAARAEAPQAQAARAEPPQAQAAEAQPARAEAQAAVRTARWAWATIAAMAVPVLATVVVVLT